MFKTSGRLPIKLKFTIKPTVAGTCGKKTAGFLDSFAEFDKGFGIDDFR